MAYLTEIIEYGRPRQIVDLSRFAADLAAALDKLLPGIVVKHEPPAEYANHEQTIAVGNDRLRVHGNTYQTAARVVLYLDAPDVPHGDWSVYDKDQKTTSAAVNPDGRAIDAIARDVKKRVIDANQAALAKRREHAKQQASNRDDIVRHADELKAAVPGLDIRVEPREQNARIFGGDRFHGYLSGTLHHDGSVTLDRISRIPNKSFRKIAALLAIPNGGRAR